MSFFAYWTLFALAAVVLATGAAAVRQAFAGPLLIAGFAGGLVLFVGEWRMPPAVTAAAVGLLAWVQLLAARPGRRGDGSADSRAGEAVDDMPQPARLSDGRPAAGALSLLGSGFIAAQAGALAVGWGAPGALAFPSVALVLLATLALDTLRPAFAPRRLRDEAALFLLVSGLCLAAAPEVIAGWGSATALNASARGGAGTAMPGWVLASVGLAALAGAISRWWRRS